MKRIGAWGFMIFTAVLLCSCGEKQEPVNMSMTEEDGHVVIIWEDRRNAPFCVVSKNDCGTLIGYIDGDTGDRVCEYKDYPLSGWVANYLTVDGGAMLYKENSVTEIPDGLESEYEWNK
ncbi:MAG: hypothetical protein NC400_14635 [Clostridium sp.]|nr:hypothetical protein [Clostridium sp.]